MGGFPTSLGLALVTALALVSGACNRPTSENIQLWKTTQKGPDRLHEALADHAVRPGLRAEAAAALVDIGRADEADTVIAQMPAGERAEICKTLIPACEVAMKDPSPEQVAGRARCAVLATPGVARRRSETDRRGAVAGHRERAAHWPPATGVIRSRRC